MEELEARVLSLQKSEELLKQNNRTLARVNQDLEDKLLSLVERERQLDSLLAGQERLEKEVDRLTKENNRLKQEVQTALSLVRPNVLLQKRAESVITSFPPTAFFFENQGFHEKSSVFDV